MIFLIGLVEPSIGALSSVTVAVKKIVVFIISKISETHYDVINGTMLLRSFVYCNQGRTLFITLFETMSSIRECYCGYND